MDDKTKTLKEMLERFFTREYIRGVGVLIHTLAEKFYEQNSLKGKVYFNEDIFDACLTDILVDLARLKDFHDIERVNYVKLIAYTASWCLKRKLFQLVGDCGEEFVSINEKFAFTLLLEAGGCFDNNVRYEIGDQSALVKNMAQVFYHLRYRNTNPQTLELFLIGLESGRKLHMVD